MSDTPVTTRTGIVIGGAHVRGERIRTDLNSLPMRTSKGIIIGGAYMPPSQPMSRDAERLQAALLTPVARPVSLSACTMDSCASGRRPCPCPDACHLPEQEPLSFWRRLLLRLL